MAYDENRAPIVRDGVVVTNEMATPLQSGMHRYWDAHWKNIVLQFLSASHPNVEIGYSNGGNEFIATFRVHDRLGRELCESSSSLADPKTIILERELDELVAGLDRLHKEAGKESAPEGLRRFVREYRIPDPMQMPNAWRVSRGSERRLFVLWGYHDKGAANSVVLPLTPTSTGWADVERRVDIKEKLRAAGRIRKSRFDWGWMSVCVLLAMAVFTSLGYGALQVFRHRTKDCSEDVFKVKPVSVELTVEPTVEPENKTKDKPDVDSVVQPTMDDPLPGYEVITNLEAVDETEIGSVEETRRPVQELNTEHVGAGVSEVTPVTEIRQPMPESTIELAGKDVLEAEAETETETTTVQSHLEQNPRTNAVPENVEVPEIMHRDKTIFKKLVDEVKALINTTIDANPIR